MLLSRAHRPIDLSVKWGALVAGSTCSLLVAGPRGRIALRVPPTVTVAELLADACAALGGETEDAGHWVLATPRGEALDPERSVGQLNLLDGALLVLRAASQAEAANIREDLPEAVGASLEEAPGRWSAQAADTLAAVFASALALLSAVVVWRATPELTRAELAFGGGLGLVVVCVLLSRFTPMARTAMWMALAALPMFAIGGGSVMSVVPAGMPAAAALGLLAGGPPRQSRSSSPRRFRSSSSSCSLWPRWDCCPGSRSRRQGSFRSIVRLLQAAAKSPGRSPRATPFWPGCW